jgi:beta-galactosidase
MGRLVACCLLVVHIFIVQSIHAQRTLRLLDSGWSFHRGDIPDMEQPEDSTWKKVDLPHDWSIEDLPGTTSPYNPDAVNGISMGFTTGGTAWYRRSFTVLPGQERQQTTIRFDGVYMNADIWLNGIHLGMHPYGYTAFRLDITKALRYGATNILTVRVRNEGATSRWYPGSGIYRHVWMETTPAVHVAPWGTYIRTTRADTAVAIVDIRTTLQNQQTSPVHLTLQTTILDATGHKVGAAETSNITLMAGDSVDLEQSVRVNRPSFWSGEHPVLYKAVTKLYDAEAKVIDESSALFGIRTISFDVTRGFLLNGKPVKLKGGCVHADNGPLGSRSFDRAEERKVQLLLANGYNAVRCAHNPPSPAFLDACDRLGMLVIDEAFDYWQDGKNAQDYHLYFDDWWQSDLQSMVFRDRNHPAVILWSIGNEIPNKDSPRVAILAQELADFSRGLDPSRGIISAVNGISDQTAPFMAALDVAGYNYERARYSIDHDRYPKRVMLSTESSPLDAYDYWKQATAHPYVAGDFVWTAWDYIGESSIGWRCSPADKHFYPWHLAFCGDIDICGWKRPASYFRDALWDLKDNISLFTESPSPSFEPNPQKPDWCRWNWFDVVARWNWEGKEGQPLFVDVYSTCPEAELFLNDRSLGRKPVTNCTAVWTVPYAAGALRAVGYRRDKPACHALLNTASKAVNIRLTADRNRIVAGGEDLSYVTVEVVDAKGVRDPRAVNRIHFQVEGAGSIAGIGNGDPLSKESYQLPEHQCWEGRCLVILRSGHKKGLLTLKVSSEGLPDNSVTVNVD